MTSSSALELYPVNSQADETEEKSMTVAKNFVAMMDNYTGWSPHELHEDAVMDWFGCCLRGRSAIVYHLKSHVPKMHHVIERVSKIPPIKHRLLRKSEKSKALPQALNKPSTEECGQGDCKGLSTPENSVVPNLKEMVKAPRVKRPNINTLEWEECEFIEIRGKLEFDNAELFGSNAEKKLERIVIGYRNQIHFIIYEAKNNCRKKLFV